MHSLIDLCFLCTKDYNNCVLVNEKVVSQVEYLLPEITIIKLGIPLRICSSCDGALCAFSKFKQSSVESSRNLEVSIKGAQGPPLHTGSPPVVDNNETSDAKPEKVEEIFIKEEYVEKTPLDTQMQTDKLSLNPIVLLERINVEHYYQLQNMQLHNIEEMFIKEEQNEETPLDREFYSNILKEEYLSNLTNDDTDIQPIHNTEDESATFNNNEEVWEESSADYEEETVEETDGNSIKNIQTNTKKIINQNATFKTNEKNLEEKENFTDFEQENVEETDGNCTKNIRHRKIRSKVKDFQCELCKKIFTSKHGFKYHMNSHLGVKNFQCEICKKLFTSKLGLNYHINSHLGVKNFQCEICKKLFTSKHGLNNHINIHLGVKNFQCEICKKLFTSKVGLNYHMNSHLGVKNFQCEICKKLFSCKQGLHDHVKRHFGVTDFQCTICEKAFVRKQNLTKHIKIHMGIKDFQCEICKKLFTSSSSLNDHMKIHLGLKEFQCEICEKSFTLKSNFIRHMKIHSGVKDFQCEICKKSFALKNNLIRHKKTH